MYNQTLRIYW